MFDEGNSRRSESLVQTTVALVATLFAFSFVLGMLVSSYSQPSVLPLFDKCSGNGFVEPDVMTCECFDCFTGPDCKVQVVNCSIDATTADAGMYEEYFERHAASSAALFRPLDIPAWYRPPYQPPFVMPSRFATPFASRVYKSVSALHASVGNFNTAGKTLIMGSGSTQVIRALLAVAAQRAGHPLWVYARPPYYSAFKGWADENPARTFGLTNRTDLPADQVVEIVTWPGNPDGQMSPPAYPNASMVIYDLVYYWPSSFPNISTLDVDVAVFSQSKLSGHAASRFGWAWLKDANIAMATIGFFFSETYGTSIDGIYRSMTINDGLVAGTAPSSSINFFKDASVEFASRWVQLQQVFQKTTKFVLRSAPNTWFAWIECVGVQGSCTTVFDQWRIRGKFGDGEAGVEGYIRLNLNLRASTWKLLMDRLNAMFQAMP
jgi:hypothetical protein